MGFRYWALVLVLGIAVALVCTVSDYSRASDMHGRMQEAVETTSRMLFDDAGEMDMPTAKTDDFAKNYFFAVFEYPETATVDVSAAIVRSEGGGRRVVVYGHGEVRTQFLRLVGLPTLSVRASAAVDRG